MDYVPPLGGTSGDPFVNPSPGVRGSIATADVFENPQREIVHAISSAGLSPSDLDRTQLRQAIQALVSAAILAYGSPGGATFPALQLIAANVVSGILAFARLPVGYIPRNFLRNGGMQVWQRGTSFAIAGTRVYTADRWAAMVFGGTGATVSRQATTAANCQWALRLQRNAASTDLNFRLMAQVLTSADTALLAGKTCTLSFYAQAGANFSAAGSVLGSVLRYGTGTDQSMASFLSLGWTGSTDIGNTSHTLTTSMQRFTNTFTIPANATQVGIALYWLPVGTAGAADYVDVTGIQLHIGNEVCEFQHDRYAHTLRECQRFYAKTFDGDVAPAENLANNRGAIVGAGTPAASNDLLVNWFYPVPMRAVPTITTFNPRSTGGGWRNEGDSVSYAADVTAIGDRACAIGTTANVTTGQRVYIHATADAEL